MIGITERGDAALDTSWINWVKAGKPAILITKDPLKLSCYPYLKSEFNIIIHCTITGFGSSIIEPNVSKVQDSTSGIARLKMIYPDNRLVLRIDPIIPTDKGIEKAKYVLSEVLKLIPNIRLRISFIDQYNHVKERFSKAGFRLPWDTFHAPLELRKKAYNELSLLYKNIEICGEPDFECTGCISQKDCDILRINVNNNIGAQRQFCKCLAEKHELLNNKKPCKFSCLYCYWR